MPEMVRSEQVQNDNHGVKTVTVGNANGDYALVQYESGQLHDAGGGLRRHLQQNDEMESSSNSGKISSSQ
jgi:hypothetical protein